MHCKHKSGSENKPLRRSPLDQPLKGRRKKIETKNKKANYINFLNMKKQIVLILSMLTLAVLYTMPLLAQPPSLPSLPGAAPIDGGLSLLVAAGVGYGAKKIREKRKRENDNQSK